MRSLKGNPYLLLTAASLFWAGNVIASRLAVGAVSPMLLTTARWAGVLLLLPWIVRRDFFVDLPQLKRHFLSIFWMGTLGFTAFNAFYYLAAHYTTAVNIGLIQGSIPALVLLLAFLLRGTPARPRQVLGMAATLFGVFLVATGGHLDTLATLSLNGGDLLMFGACLAYAFYTISLAGRPKVSALSFFAGLSLAAFLSSLPLLALEIAWQGFFMPSLKGWLTIAYCAVFPSVLSQIFFMRGVELIGPGRAGLFVNFIPVFTPLLAVLFLDETFALHHGVALSLVLGGILWAERKSV